MVSKLKGRKRSAASRRKQSETIRRTLRLKRLAQNGTAKSAPATGSRRMFRAQIREVKAEINAAVARLARMATQR